MGGSLRVVGGLFFSLFLLLFDYFILFFLSLPHTHTQHNIYIVVLIGYIMEKHFAGTNTSQDHAEDLIDEEMESRADMARKNEEGDTRFEE